MPAGPETANGLADRLRDSGDPKVINEALSLSERFPGEVVSELWKHAGHTATIGITGPPGVGKSTLTPGLVFNIREQDRTVGVIAVDPSTPGTGGAILGDRGRMMDAARERGYDITADKGVWIRSLSARGHFGGVSKATLPAILAFDVAGKDVVIVETVGVGQSELDICSLVDTTAVVLQPGSGDSIQAMKSGLMEIPDILCINKKDVSSSKARHNLHLELSGAGVPIIETDALSGDGVDDLLEAIDNHRTSLGKEGLRERRQKSLGLQLAQISVAYSNESIERVLRSEAGRELLEQVDSRKKDLFQAARELRDLVVSI